MLLKKNNLRNSMINQKIRYAPIMRMLKNCRPSNICEIGSGSQGLGRYERNLKFTGVDLDFSDYSGSKQPVASNMVAVQAKADGLPFQDGAFDFVFSLDMIEHIQPQERKAVIKEMIRISSEVCVMAFPCGDAARENDAKMREFYRARGAAPPGWLEEHLKAGFPQLREVEGILESIGLNYDSFDHEPIWLRNLILKIEKVSKGWSGLDTIVPMNVLHLISSFGRQHYRKFYVISK